MKSIIGNYSDLIKKIRDKKRGHGNYIVGFGSFNISKKRNKAQAKILKRIAKKLESINPELAKKFVEAHELTHVVQQRTDSSVKSTSKHHKFKPGSELSNNVKSAAPSDSHEELGAEVEIKSANDTTTKDTDSGSKDEGIYPDITRGSIEIEQDIE